MSNKQSIGGRQQGVARLRAADGNGPSGPLSRDSDGDVFDATGYCRANGAGTAFELKPVSSEVAPEPASLLLASPGMVVCGALLRRRQARS